MALPPPPPPPPRGGGGGGGGLLELPAVRPRGLEGRGNSGTIALLYERARQRLGLVFLLREWMPYNSGEALLSDLFLCIIDYDYVLVLVLVPSEEEES